MHLRCSKAAFPCGIVSYVRIYKFIKRLPFRVNCAKLACRMAIGYTYHAALRENRSSRLKASYTPLFVHLCPCFCCVK